MSDHSPLKHIKTIRDLEISKKTVFMRLDLNVPLSGGTVTDDNRLQEALPTLKYAIEAGAKLILASHLGRPDGKKNPEFSLEPVAAHLSGLLGQDIMLAEECIGEGIELMTKSLQAGQILMLENLRFHAEEEKNDPTFAQELAKLAEVYITDAFGTAHRKHASTYGVPSMMGKKGCGFLIEKELKYLDPLLHNPQKPFHLLLGGAKVSDKIQTIQSLLKNVDGILVGGAMAYAFTAASGDAVPPHAKQPGAKDIEAAKNILQMAKRKSIPILLPVDMNEVFDIGPKTVAQFSEFLQKAGTVFWNGPVGWFEKPPYDKGTFALAKFLSELPAIKIVGGGDTVSAVKQSGYAEKFDHLSTGGGAVLEYLEGNGLPGIDILANKSKRTEPEYLSIES